MKFKDQLNKEYLDILVKQLKADQEKSEYIKELEEAYLKTRKNDSERFK